MDNRRTVFLSATFLSKQYKSIPVEVLENAILLFGSKRSWLFPSNREEMLEARNNPSKYLEFDEDYKTLILHKEEQVCVFSLYGEKKGSTKILTYSSIVILHFISKGIIVRLLLFFSLVLLSLTYMLILLFSFLFQKLVFWLQPANDYKKVSEFIESISDPVSGENYLPLILDEAWWKTGTLSFSPFFAFFIITYEYI